MASKNISQKAREKAAQKGQTASREMNGTYILSGGADDKFVACGRSRQGSLFRKHVLPYGPFAHPKNPKVKINVDDTMLDKIIENFETGVTDIVHVPVADDNNQHTDDPNRNIGEVIGWEKGSKGLYALIDVREPTAIPKMGKTLLGCSALLHLNYPDSKTGKLAGPAIAHVCVTNRPHLTNLDGYEELASLTADTSGEPILLTPEGKKMGKRSERLAELKKLIKEDPDLLDELLGDDEEEEEDETTSPKNKGKKDDKPEPKEETEKVDPEKIAASVAKDITDKLVVALTGGNPDENDETASKIAELLKPVTDSVAALSADNDRLKKEAAETKVKGLVRSGHILKANAGAMTELALSNPTLFESLIPKEPIIKLANTSTDAERGVDSEGEENFGSMTEKQFEEEVARLTAEHGDVIGLSKKD